MRRLTLRDDSLKTVQAILLHRMMGFHEVCTISRTANRFLGSLSLEPALHGTVANGESKSQD